MTLETEGTINAGGLFADNAKAHVGNRQSVSSNPNDAATQKDSWNANKFAHRYDSVLRYVHAEKVWFLWNGTIWERCGCSQQVEVAKEYIQWLFNVALPDCRRKHDPEKAEKFAKHCAYSATRAGIDNMLTLARSDARLAVASLADFDRDPWLFQAANGVINLKTGQMLEPDPKLMITRCSPVNFVRDAECPIWERYLSEVFPEDSETVDFMQRFMGYTLSGDVSEEKMVIELGVGSNGKSVRDVIHRRIMGSYGASIPSDVIASPPKDEGGDRPSPGVVAMCGLRYASFNETEAGDRLNENAVKRVTGIEAIAARQLYGTVFEFTPTAKAAVRTNHRPIVRGTDNGIWRRLILVPYDRVFTEDDKDPKLKDKLLAESEGILAWMVAGFQKWEKDGLKLGPQLKKELAEYRTESDILGDFLSDYPRSKPGKELRILEKDLFGEYQYWATTEGYKPVTKNSFTRQLRERGIKQTKTTGVRYYTGIGVKPPSGLRKVG